MRKWLTGVATVLLLGSLVKSDAATLIDDFVIDYHEFSGRVRKIAEDKGVRIGSVIVTRCDNSPSDGITPYFCDTGLFAVRVRLWLQSNGGPTQAISAYLGGRNGINEFILSMIVFILAVDPDISEAEASAIAERLSTAPRTLSGRIEATGIRAQFSTAVERGFFIFRALPQDQYK